MSNSKMLIDASHPEETRVVVLQGNRVEEFDFESASKKQLRGNIYLAKVTRVEPSLQAAFVEYGGNRHGFLAFSEIHPDYYQIPFADRQALLEEEARAHRDEDDEPRESRGGGRGEGRGGENRGGEGRGGENRNRDGRRGDGRGGEGRGGENRGGETRAVGEAGESGGERAPREGRGDREGRGNRNERGQRRSRRHRRDGAAPMERRGPADESVSEVAFDGEAIEGVTEPSLDLGSDAVEASSPVAAAAEADAPSQPFDTDGRDASDHDDASEAAPAGDVAAEPELFDEPAPEEAPVHAETAAVEDEPARPLAAEEALAAVDESPSAESPADDVPGHDLGSEVVEDGPAAVEGSTDAEAHEAEAQVDDTESRDRGTRDAEARDTPERHGDEHHAAEHEEEHVEQIGGDALSDVAPRPVRLRRHYKIQEVIKRRQILLIQVVKEERGNKGAALTTYLSLAGRYSVLMPNTAKGGGISRKITDGEDRKRLKAIAGELDVPEGMGVILRTAGASRTPVEVRRDFEYLLRMWESVRELTLKSSAPTLVYEEGSLIKRSIRDLYSKEVEEIVVSGDEGFAEARDFMRMLMPGNVKSVVSYRDPQPIFAKSGVEAQLDAMFSPHVTLKSGGYIVINQTEALVAIDVNSGRSTREHNIEDTALRTNMEAADEVARQLRLRDLAGLIVVDFIDMEEGRNNRAVERRIKEALKNDRARIQIGRISHFGLLEMSRQRIRTGVLEGSTVVCPHCAGAGTVRSTASIALHVLRLLEDALIKDAAYDLVVRSRAEVALYVLNQKRAKLVELEQRFGVTLTVTADPTLTGMIYHAIERGEPATPAIAPAPRQDLVRVDSIAPIFEPGSESEDDVFDIVEAADEGETGNETGDAAEASSSEPGDGERRRKRRRRRRGRDRDGASEISADAPQPSDDGLATVAEIDGDLMPTTAPDAPAEPEFALATQDEASEVGTEPAAPVTAETVAEAPMGEAVTAPAEELPTEELPTEEAPKRRRSRRTRVEKDGAAEPVEVAAPPAAEDEAPKRRRRPSRARAAGPASVEVAGSAPEIESVAQESAAPETDPLGSRPAADRDVGADTAEHHAPMAEAEAFAVRATDHVPAEDAGSAPAAAPEPESDRPKRSGWWQRAKTSFGA